MKTLSLQKKLDRIQQEIFVHPDQALVQLNSLFKSFLDREEIIGALMVWPLLIKAVIFAGKDLKALDPYLRWYESVKKPKGLTSIFDLLIHGEAFYLWGLYLRRPEDPLLKTIEYNLYQRLSEISYPIVKSDVLFILALRAFAQGNLKKFDHLADEIQFAGNIPIQAFLWRRWIKAAQALWVYGDFQKTETLLKKTCKAAPGPWVAPFLALYFVQAVFNKEQEKTALILQKLDPYKGGRYVQILNFYLWGWSSFLQKNYHQAEFYLLRAKKTLEDRALRSLIFRIDLALAQVSFYKGQLPRAVKILKRCDFHVQKGGSKWLQFELLLFRSYMAYLSGDKVYGAHFLKRALYLGNRENYMNFFWWSNTELLSYLATRALEQGFYPEYVKQWIIRHRLKPPSVNVPQKWPYLLRVKILGGVEISTERGLTLTDKRPSFRLLELLVVLLITDGEIPKARLLELLWPELAPDSAYHALETTLYRLRKFLGYGGLILSQGRTVRLDKSYCLVDLWTLKQHLEGLSRALIKKLPAEVFSKASAVTELYEELMPGYDLAYVVHERKVLKRRTHFLLTKALSFLKTYLPEESSFLEEKLSRLSGFRSPFLQARTI